jgi:hypothetical protein
MAACFDERTDRGDDDVPLIDWDCFMACECQKQLEDWDWWANSAPLLSRCDEAPPQPEQPQDFRAEKVGPRRSTPA